VRLASEVGTLRQVADGDEWGAASPNQSTTMRHAAQIDTLLSNGYSGHLSFEPFAESVHGLADIKQALGASIAHLQKR
jgi:predicted xylose isomerase-like sugar epimerase